MEAIRNILETAINKFNENDVYLIENDLSDFLSYCRFFCYSDKKEVNKNE